MTDVQPDQREQHPHDRDPGQGAPADTAAGSAGAAVATLPQGDDPLARLHKMSTTAGLGTTDYVAINPMSVATLFAGLASALALLDPILLAIPVVAIILGIVSLRQIWRSGGTQTGRGLAWSGLVLAVLFAAVVGARAGISAYKNRADTEAIAALVDAFNGDLTAGKLEDAYRTRTTDRFQGKFKLQQFQDTWKAITGGKYYGKFLKVESNNRLDFETSSQGEKMASGMMIADFQGTKDAPSSDRLEAVYKKGPDGQWRIDAMPTLFSEQQQPSPAQSSGGQRR